MKVIFAKGIPARWQESVKNLLAECDREFVPALSSRDSTSHLDFAHLSETKKQPYPQAYYRSMCEQRNLLLIDPAKGELAGFISYALDYVCEYTGDYMPNVYVSTIIVSPKHRHHGYAMTMYKHLLAKYPVRHIFTRTWSQNNSHIRILRSLKFYEHERLADDRGEGIDTVYYHLEPRRKSVLAMFKYYRLHNSLIFSLILAVLTLAAFLVWFYSTGEVVHELAIAVATSLLASLVCLGSDTIIKYRDAKNDDYINRLKSFGIANLQFHKDDLLESIIPTVSREIWISGYRLIMTAKKPFCDAMALACKRNPALRIRMLLVPPWSDAYRMVYGDEDVTRNYFTVINLLSHLLKNAENDLEIRFTNKPIFNDTYKVDSRFVTGPYLHCLSSGGDGKITAKDFFSLDIDDENKELYRIMHSDYMAVWNECTERFDVGGFVAAGDFAGYDDFAGSHSLQDFVVEIG